MNNRMLMIATALLSSTTLHATELVYNPLNPSFGGNALIGSYLLNKANAQNDHTEEASGDDFVTRFQESLERNMISEITRGVTNGDIESGTFTSGDYLIDIVSLGSDTVITITNVLDPTDVTIIRMSDFG
ncbi:curli assembly protein CsgF [Shewanella surugensis]|uniref:Curli production assembly/transport component CsgF n=1 Tax=Shewanella surugensis TaxID=212020 RepID=A0ABT0LH63_9GAMM|nr:curli assembly protein CsgF [Shewanella surugensis]MCL1127010.1 curli assembly protein CsgF [Shewanella surugensis]